MPLKKSCVLKQRVSYNKIPEKCFEICKNITRRQKNHKKRKKQISFNIDPPVNSNTLPSNFVSTNKDTASSSSSTENKLPTETSTYENPPSSSTTENKLPPETSKDENPPTETNNDEQTNETSIINRITNSASSLLGLSNKKGGKSAKKRKNNNKGKSSKKRKNKLKR
jgi:hypothetical protein